MKNLKVWPHLIIIAVVCAAVAGVGVAMWMKHEQTASAESVMNAARIQRVEGDVALNNGLAGDAAKTEGDQWIAATDNQPFSVGDRIYTRDNSRASLAFTGRNFARLNPNTSLDVLTLSDQRTQLALRDGSAMFDVGYLGQGDLFEVATPYGAVDFEQPGLYNVGLDNNQVIVSVLSGLAQVVGLEGSGQISKGEMLTLIGQTAADVVLSQIDGRNAGYLVDDYYAYQYPRYYDGRYRDYNSYLSDPYYFDPYRRNVSYQYANSYIPGLYDLDYYGDWQNVSGYGYAWAPRVDNGWMPYQTGYWYTDYPYGPTWVSSEPWGYAPYHYGRWAFVGDRWYWIPDRVSGSPRYSPALVAFIPFGQNEVGWVPLGPGDVYVPHYYNAGWQPYYLNDASLYQRVVNLNVPGAVTIVSFDDFTRDVDWRHARKADRSMLAQVNPVLDPLLLTPLRNAVVNSAWGRGKKDIPPGIAKRLRDTTVITSAAPIAPAFRPNFTRSMRVDTASNRARNQKFKVRDERQGRRADQSSQATDRASSIGQSQRELRRGEQEQRKQQSDRQRVEQTERGQRAAGSARQQAQGERVGQPAAKQERRGARQPRVRRDPGVVRSPAPRASRSTVAPARRQPSGPPARSQPAPARERQRPSGAPARSQPASARERQRPSGVPARSQPAERGSTPRAQSQQQKQQGPPQKGGGKGKPRKP